MVIEPFRGSVAVAAGLVSPNQLRGPRFRRLFTDVYVVARAEVTLALRSRGAYLLVAGRGTLGGWSAAELQQASCGPADAPAEVALALGQLRTRPGLVVRRHRLLPGEAVEHDGIRVTTPCRTAFDLARALPRREAVVAVDALARAGRFSPADLAALATRHPRAHHLDRLPEIVRLARTGSDSPQETRIRLAIIDGGLPEPVLQHPVGPYFLDLAYPALRLGIEYDGRDHLTPDRARHDLDRQAYLSSRDWTVLRIPPYDALRRPDRVAARVHAALARLAEARGLSYAAALAMIVVT